MSTQKSTREVLLDRLCTQIFRIQIIFLTAALFLAFSVAAVFVLEPGSSAYVVNALNLVGLTVFVAVFGTLTYLCNNRDPT